MADNTGTIQSKALQKHVFNGHVFFLNNLGLSWATQVLGHDSHEMHQYSETFRIELNF